MKACEFIKKNILLLTAGLLTACSEDVNVNNDCGQLQIEVSASSEDGDKTRASYSGFSASFENGDKIGVYAIENGSIVATNVPFTYNGSSWSTTGTIKYSNSYKYYAYYPYTATPYSINASSSTVNGVFASFISDSSDKFHSADQSSKAKFTACDLMAAAGSSSGTGKVIFHMDHKKGLAVFEGEGVSEASFSGNLPYSLSGKKYFLMKASTSTAFNDGKSSFSLTASGGKYVKKSIEKAITGDYLTFTAEAEGTFTLTIPAGVGTDLLTSVSYSVNGDEWVTTNNSSSEVVITTPTVAAGGKVMWKGTGSALAKMYAYSTFSSTTRFSVSGNIMSMLYGDNYSGKTSLNENCTFAYLFSNSKVTAASSLKLPATTLFSNCYNNMFKGCISLTSVPSLPATTLAIGCYGGMFSGCTSLTSAPLLPATNLAYGCYSGMFNNCTSLRTVPSLNSTTLASSCYEGMFNGCTSLTTAPALPATTLASGCYDDMFANCTSLTSAPSLPATTLDVYCYTNMFNGCTSLTSAPSLPATTLEDYCYYQMFYNCTSLKTAPTLPATNLVPKCYDRMFYGCTNLSYIKALFTTTPSNSCTEQWVYGVKSTGTFVKNPEAIWDVTGTNGVPVGWDVYPKKNYLAFKAEKAGTFTLTVPAEVGTDLLTSVSYSVNYGETWVTTNNSSSTVTITTPTIAAGDYVMWKGIGSAMLKTGNYKRSKSIFSSSEKFSLSGNIMSMLYGDNFNGKISFTSEYTFASLFENSKVTSAKNLILPATSLSRGCYQYMFQNCSYLSSAPKLPATTLDLVCYSYMFNGCSSLTTAPSLPATTLTMACYDSMFKGCTSLTSAPELPATTLTMSCYSEMFMNCTSLTKAPVLPATNLVSMCYLRMFKGCSNLSYIKALFTTTPEPNYTNNWVNGVKSTGTFVKNSAATWNVQVTGNDNTGYYGIPSTWTVQIASE